MSVPVVVNASVKADVGRTGFTRASIGEQSRGVVAVAVTVLIQPLRPLFGQRINDVVPTVSVVVGATQTVPLGRVAGLGWTSVRVGPAGVVAKSIAVAVGPLGSVAGVCVFKVAPAVAVGVRATVRTVLPRRTKGGWTGIGHQPAGVVAVTVTIRVVPLGGIGHERIGPVGRCPTAGWFGVSVTVLIRAPFAVVNGRAVEQRAIVVKSIVVAVPVPVAPARGVVGKGIGTVVDGVTGVGVGIPVAVRVGAPSSVLR